MSPSHSLRARTHPTYVDDDSDADSSAEPSLILSPHPTSHQTVKSVSQKRSMPRRVKLPPVPHRIPLRTIPSPPTSPYFASQASKALSRANTRLKSPEAVTQGTTDDGENASRQKTSTPDPLVNQGLHFLFTSSDNWIPFLYAWKGANAEELSRFAADVALVAGDPVDKLAPRFPRPEELTWSRAESRSRVRYQRYAMQRDARKEARILATRWSEEFGDAAMQGTNEFMDGWGSGEGLDEAGESSDESEGEGFAIGEYLVCC
ncbi:hypothetical protein P7C70_g6828, partial [Phenoliferia sp. Uapishka_3]